MCPLKELFPIDSVDQILRHWVVTAQVSRMDVANLLWLLHSGKPQIVYEQLPKTVEKLLEVGPAVKARVSIEPHRAMVARLNLPSREETVGHLLQYSMKDAVEGISPGMEDRWKYAKDLKLIHHANPNFLTKPFLALVNKTNDFGVDEIVNAGLREPICVLVDIFVDGFSPYNNTEHTFWAVYGMVTCLTTSSHRYEMKCKFATILY